MNKKIYCSHNGMKVGQILYVAGDRCIVSEIVSDSILSFVRATKYNLIKYKIKGLVINLFTWYYDR